MSAKPPPLLALKAVYSYLVPEVRTVIAAFDEVWRPELLRNDVPSEAIIDVVETSVSASVGRALRGGAPSSADELHVPILERVGEIHAPLVRGLEGFAWRYPTGGSSEGLFHLLVRLRTTGTTTIRVLEGEYEGYGVWAEQLGMTVETLAIEDVAGTPPDPAACWFISDPSARDGCLLPDRLVAGLAIRGHRIVLDLAYVGAVDPTRVRFDVTDPAIEAVVLSLSKPYGLFRWRIGYVWSRVEIPTLFSSKWFKDLGRHLLGLKVLEEVGPATIWPRHVERQRAIVARIRDEHEAPVRESEALILAHLTEEELDALPGRVRRTFAPYLRGPNVRLCLTPYFEAGDPVDHG